MYEYGIERFDELPRIAEPLRRFHTILTSDSDAFMLTSAYNYYVRDELGMSEDDADLWILVQQESGLLPDMASLLTDRDEAVDAYRMAILKDVAPYKLAAIGIAEYELWLPNAIELILPEGGERHSADLCLRTNGICKGMCERGECPVKYLRQQAEAADEPNFLSAEYKQFPEKVCSGVLTLLSSARDKGIITPIERKKFKDRYMRQYLQIFPLTTYRL